MTIQFATSTGIITKNLLPSQNPTGNPVPKIHHNFHVCSIDKNGDPTETVYELDDGGEFLEQAKVNAIPNAEEGGHDVVPNVEGEDGPSDGESGPYIVPKDKVEGYDPYTEASGDENCEEIQDPNMVRNPENYSKKGDNIQCYNEGVWED